MVGIGVELALELRERLRRSRLAARVRIGLRAVEPVDPRVGRFQRAEHVIERAVLHHQDDDVFQFVETERHGREDSAKPADTVQLSEPLYETRTASPPGSPTAYRWQIGQ